jgi:hypothetical protein
VWDDNIEMDLKETSFDFTLNSSTKKKEKSENIERVNEVFFG